MTYIEKLLPVLINKTKDKKLSWEYIVSFPKLKNMAIHLVDSDDFLFNLEIFDEDSSFYAQYKNGYFVLLNTDSAAYLLAFPTIDAKVNKALNDRYSHQSDLKRLTNLAIKQHPNVEDFIDEFLADEN